MGQINGKHRIDGLVQAELTGSAGWWFDSALVHLTKGNLMVVNSMARAIKDIAPEELDATDFLTTSDVRVRKQYGGQSLFIYAQTQADAFQTLAEFIKEYKFHVTICYIEVAGWNDYRFRLVAHS